MILADPPWRYDYTKADSRAIENQYPTLTLDGICELPVAQVFADKAILFLWATSPKVAEALQVMTAWGFDYRTCAVWVKDRIGMGYYFRQRHELLLVGTRGGMSASCAERPRGLRDNRSARGSQRKTRPGSLAD